jgi:hypothetical protein
MKFAIGTGEGDDMTVQFAERGEQQSGQRFLEGSVPRLERHVALCETADVGVRLPSAGKDQKPSWEFEGEALIGREAPVPLSLDEVQTKCDRPKGWKRSCGTFTVRGTSPTRPGHARYSRVGCKCWDCSGCGPRKAAKYRIQVQKWAKRRNLNVLLTLTLDPSKVGGEDSTKYINEVFADFRIYLRRYLGHAPVYIRILEYQKNGNAHFHILLNCRLPQSWVSETWSALGGGRIVDIRRVDMRSVSHYLSKYLTKQMLLSAPKRARRVTTSRDICLNEKLISDYEWRIIRVPILRLLEVRRVHVTKIDPDAEGYVLAFETTGEPETVSLFPFP